MNTWLALSIKLYPISKACDDQSKQTDTKHKKIEGYITEYLKLWFPYITYKNPIYHKLYTLICGLFFPLEVWHVRTSKYTRFWN